MASKYASPSARGKYLPISPSPPHPDNGKLLHLNESSLPLRKPSNINTDTKRELPLTSFRPYDGNSSNEWILLRRSYQELIEYAEFEAPLGEIHRHNLRSAIASGGYGETQSPTALAASIRCQSRSEILNHAISPDPPSHATAPAHYQTHNGDRVWATTQTLPVNTGEGRATRQGQVSREETSILPVFRPQGDYGSINSSRTPRQSIIRQPVIRRPGSVQWGGDSSDSGSSWAVLKTIFGCVLTLLLLYGTYRAGCWAIWAVGAAIEAIKHALASGIDAIHHSISAAIEAIKNAPTAVRDWVIGLFVKN